MDFRSGLDAMTRFRTSVVAGSSRSMPAVIGWASRRRKSAIDNSSVLDCCPYDARHREDSEEAAEIRRSSLIFERVKPIHGRNALQHRLSELNLASDNFCCQSWRVAGNSVT